MRAGWLDPEPVHRTHVLLGDRGHVTAQAVSWAPMVGVVHRDVLEGSCGIGAPSNRATVA